MKIAIIVGSTRPGRVGRSVGDWVAEEAAKRDDATFELVDLADFNLPLLSEPTVPGAANGKYEVAETQAWGDKIAEFDGYVFVTAEYNHSVPAAFKNAFDVLYVEWNHKAVGFVGYGADGGVRAIEHWRTIVASAHLLATRAQVSLGLFTDFGDDGFAPLPRRTKELDGVLDQVVALSGKLSA